MPDFFQHFIKNCFNYAMLLLLLLLLSCYVLKESYRLGQIPNGKCFSPAVVLKET